MKRIGFVGWRGMVGSVLMQRMREENDFALIEPEFFSTSQAGRPAPDVGREVARVKDAHDLNALRAMDVIVTSQGGGYTEAVYPELRGAGWNGYWIDAASTLRMREDSVIVLDPINRDVIDRARGNGVKTFVGGNCTVSLMLMGVGGLLQHDLVEWISPTTYQAASGAGAQHMRELVQQWGFLHGAASRLLADPANAILEIDRAISDALCREDYPCEYFGVPLAGGLIPWIDRAMDSGQSREEWKAGAETNKILGRQDNPIPMDGVCVRVGVMRSHCQALLIKLRQDVPIDEIAGILAQANEWVRVIPNEPEASKRELTPSAVTGTLAVTVGRLRKLAMGARYLSAFTAGDQLLWGAAEPLRRMLRILLAD